MAVTAATSSRAIGERIRAARERCGISLTELAVKSGVSRSVLSRMELGEAGRSMEAFLSKLAAVSDALGVAIEVVPERSRRKVGG